MVNDLIPKGKIAFKFKPEQAVSKIISFEYTAGRTGRLTPVFHIEPIELAGTVISKVSMHNVTHIEELNLKNGSHVIIQKCGDIIPQIIKLADEDDGSGTIIPKPTECPCCHGEVEMEGPQLFCMNPMCANKLVRYIIYYMEILGIKNIGVKTIEQLCEKNMVTSVTDLYKLTSQDLMMLDGFKDKSCENFLKELNKIKTIPLNVFISCLGIRSLGKTSGKDVAAYYKTVECFLNCNVSELITIDGISNKTAEYIINGIQQRSDMINELLNILYIIENVKIVGKFTDKTFCCTGKVTKPRKEIQKIIEDNGGSYKSLSKGLNFLIIGDGAKPNKIQKANDLGAIVITETVFDNMVMHDVETELEF